MNIACIEAQLTVVKYEFCICYMYSSDRSGENKYTLIRPIFVRVTTKNYFLQIIYPIIYKSAIFVFSWIFGFY